MNKDIQDVYNILVELDTKNLKLVEIYSKNLLDKQVVKPSKFWDEFPEEDDFEICKAPKNNKSK